MIIREKKTVKANDSISGMICSNAALPQHQAYKKM